MCGWISERAFADGRCGALLVEPIGAFCPGYAISEEEESAEGVEDLSLSSFALVRMFSDTADAQPRAVLCENMRHIDEYISSGDTQAWCPTMMSDMHRHLRSDPLEYARRRRAADTALQIALANEDKEDPQLQLQIYLRATIASSELGSELRPSVLDDMVGTIVDPHNCSSSMMRNFCESNLPFKEATAALNEAPPSLAVEEVRTALATVAGMID